ncbi:Rieske 2Fe-2S domain-containing protein [Streptomyces sp. NPDC001139]
MLVTAQPVLRRFWYPTLPMAALESGPQPFTLLGHDLVLWADREGRPAAAVDRCSHRFARLSKGWVKDGAINCPYHGWAFNSSGHCVEVPQSPGQRIPHGYAVSAFRCEERYGYAWVCLGEPLDDIPELPEAADPRFRVMHLESELFHCSSTVGVDNALDSSHHHYVHGTTLGDSSSPLPMIVQELHETANGLFMSFPLRNNGSTLRDKQADDQPGSGQITLIRELTWYVPFTIRIDIKFPSGTQAVTLLTYTPISDSTCQYVGVLARNDTEQDFSAKDAIAEIAAIVKEDKDVLECVDYDLPLEAAKQRHMASDKAGLIMRRKLHDLLAAHGEAEINRTSPGGNP